MLKEIIEKDKDTREKRFNEFMEKLVKLCTKYGVDLHSSGGVYVLSDYELGRIAKVNYDKDYTSGDLKVELITV